ncbi:flagellar basal-body rod protein FlgG [Neptunomonas phycophila]|uniref:Flagellar basal-body rod protein FlgG n=2 Tax=Neptunomonas phycophila TaxID=1572645 RepID=A0AAW7XND6_9GAMM|nr:flagellar basal-body rod protein FlgG [Neptunomonas phycophila]MBT3144388.1 flagellar basal-body rod protein FlgG [Neptunomonas phycophila]MDO6455266.1 flagellar basal-body rod protein FlgG [Neptunomonas phycophila]MDO6469741.1 flagellar basal-body rod protein FlgG [Neptunomonas phycophila]MDO6785618.1 flagellar basal-body rod protein FlgG [Neptunomonas phycophila]MDP2524117.1 flagellar basal-body rod protein FlgG [Neptunomonas phycophila]
MHGALFVAKTGLSAQDTSLKVISNNLANVSTVGFKKDRAVFEDLLYQTVRQPGAETAEGNQLPSGLQLGNGVRVVGTQKMFSTGEIQVTDETFDVAINGSGFFQVTMPNGDIGYTRNGQFHLNSDSELVTAEGYLIEPAITLPDDVQSFTVGVDGTVEVVVAGDATPTQIGTLEIADFVNPQGLQAIGQNLFLETAASGAPQVAQPGEEGLGILRQGMLEASNVNAVEELVNMITTQRAYEINSKVISTADEMLSFVTQQL